jgi:hypothetical protein
VSSKKFREEPQREKASLSRRALAVGRLHEGGPAPGGEMPWSLASAEHEGGDRAKLPV